MSVPKNSGSKVYLEGCLEDCSPMKMFYFVVIKFVFVFCCKLLNLPFFLFIHKRIMLAEGFDTV